MILGKKSVQDYMIQLKPPRPPDITTAPNSILSYEIMNSALSYVTRTLHFTAILNTGTQTQVSKV